MGTSSQRRSGGLSMKTLLQMIAGNSSSAARKNGRSDLQWFAQ
jgi:hypothetical protein